MPISVLGRVELSAAGDVALAQPSERQTRLLAALATRAGSTVDAEELVHLTWDDDELPQGGVRALRTRIARLRPLLAVADVELVTDGSGYRVGRDAIADVARFEELFELAERLAADGRTAEAAEQLDEAVALWRGPAYAQFASFDWARTEALRLNDMRSLAAERRFELLLSARRHDQVVAEIRTAIDLDQWRERLRCQLAIALYRSGRQADALRSIASYRRELAAELGLDPGAELVELEQQMLQHAPSLNAGLDGGDVAGRPLRGYDSEEVIGHGAFSVVWRGRQAGLQRAVAIKQIRASLANRPEFIRRFEVEAQMVASLEHPYIVPLYDFWREPDAAYIVMRLMRGSLERRLGDRPLSEGELRRLIEQVGSALHAAHSAGVVHLDVKPGNVLMDDGENFFLADFGTAASFDPLVVGEAAVRNISAVPDGDRARPAGRAIGDDVEAVLTGVDDVRVDSGSPLYASPEQVRGDDVGVRSDVFSFGVTLFEAATGRLPFDDPAERYRQLRRGRADRYPPPSALASVPTWLDSVCERATAPDPADRFASIEELVDSLPAAPARTSTVPAPARDDGVATGPLLPRRARGAADSRNPYKGLRAFGEADHPDFHGRRRLVERLLNVLAPPAPAGRLAAVVGPSGSGKSSVVRAGLLPALRRGEIEGSSRWFITTMTPGERPFEELEAALLRIAPSPPGPLVEMMRDEHGLIRAINHTAPTAGADVLIVIDQFEELFTLTNRDADRQMFLDRLVELLDDPMGRTRVVVTIRADFWDRPLEHPRLAALLDAAAVAVGPLAADELEQAIVAPAMAHGVSFEPGLVAMLMAEANGQAGALPLLQFALSSLFEQRAIGGAPHGAPGGGDVMLVETFSAMGGMAGALARRADEVFAGLNEAEQAAARAVFERLVTLGDGAEDTRRRVAIDELGHGAAVSACLESFGAARLLTFDRDRATRQATIEIAHEALLMAWPRLRRWIDDDRDRLRRHRQVTAAAQQWEAAGRGADELLRGGRLELAQELVAADAELNDVEVAFIAASAADADRQAAAEHRRQRILRRSLVTAVVMLVAALVAGAIAVVQRNSAQSSRAAEALARRQADIERIAAEGVARAEDDPQLAMLLVAEAHRQEPGPATLGAIQRAMLRTGPLLGFIGRPDVRYSDVRWAGDELVAIHSGGFEVYSVETGRLTASVDVVVSERPTAAVSEEPVVVFDVSPAGDVVAIATPDSTVQLFALDGTPLQTLQHVDPVSSVALSPDGTLLAAGDLAGRVSVWDVQTGVVRYRIDAHVDDLANIETRMRAPSPAFAAVIAAGIRGIGVAALAFTADGELLSHGGGSVRWSDPATGEQLRVAGADIDLTELVGVEVLSIHQGAFIRLVPGDPSIAYLVARNSTSVISLVDGARQAQQFMPPGRDDSNDGLSGADALPGGDLLSANSDGRVVRTTADGEIVETLFPGLDRLGGLHIDTASRRVAVAGAGGVAILSLDGSTALSAGVPRLPGRASAAINRSGSEVLQSPFVSGPTVSYRRTAQGFVEHPLPPAVAELQSDITTRPDGRDLYVTFDRERGGGAYDVASGEQVWSGPGINLASVFSRDGRWVTLLARGPSLGGDAQARTLIIEVEQGDVIASIDAPTAATAEMYNRSHSFSADDERLFITTQDGELSAWDTSTWEQVELDDIGGVVIASFDPSGELVATMAPDGVVTLRAVDTLAPIRTLTTAGPPAIVGGTMQWSDDGALLLSEAAVEPQLWDPLLGLEIGEPFPNERGFSYLGRSGSPMQLVTAVGDVINVWNLDVDSWPDIACRMAGRNMTLEEWATYGPSDTPYQATCPQFPPAA